MSEVPDRFIAIRRHEARTATAGRRKGSVLRVWRATEPAPMAALASIGLEEVQELAALPSEPDVGGYVQIPELASLIVEPPRGASAEDVRAVLGDEYLVMPDLELSLPPVPTAPDDAPADEVCDIDSTLDPETGITAAHEAGNRGGGAVVAVLDTGCDADHREFVHRTVDYGYVPLDRSDVRERRGFDTATHGTHVCGTIGGATVGVAPEAELIVASVIESERVGTSAWRLWKALGWLLERLRLPRYDGRPVILSMSLGFSPEQIAPAEIASTMEVVRTLLRDLIEASVLPIVAIGNDGPNTVRAPGYFPEVLSVGAIGYDRAVWRGSSGGQGPAGFETRVSPDIAGFGVAVRSGTHRDVSGTSRYGPKTGTSMATPYVAGVAALAAVKTGLSGEALRDHLLDTALPLGSPPDRVGAGLACCA